MKSLVHRGAIKATVFLPFAVLYALATLWFATALSIARDGGGHPDNRPVSLGMVPLAHVAPHTVTLPVVDGTDIRFARISTADGLSQTNLMLNAIEAIKETGGELRITAEVGRDGQLLISISDTGVGSPAEIVSK